MICSKCGVSLELVAYAADMCAACLGLTGAQPQTLPEYDPRLQKIINANLKASKSSSSSSPHETERDFMDRIIKYARLKRWRVAHFRPGMTGREDSRGKPLWVTAVQADGAGFADLILVRDTRLIAAEIKSMRGVLTAAQHDWLNAFRAAGVETYTWKPADWPEIVKILE